MVTIKQIAQEVGISSSTVSIVLGGKAAERKISTATQEKIFAAAARLGYQLIGTAAAPQTPGSHIGLVAKPCQ